MRAALRQNDLAPSGRPVRDRAPRSLHEIGGRQGHGFGDDEAQCRLPANSDLSLVVFDPVIGLVDQRDLFEARRSEGPPGTRSLAEGQAVVQARRVPFSTTLVRANPIACWVPISFP